LGGAALLAYDRPSGRLSVASVVASVASIVASVVASVPAAVHPVGDDDGAADCGDCPAAASGC